MKKLFITTLILCFIIIACAETKKTDTQDRTPANEVKKPSQEPRVFNPKDKKSLKEVLVFVKKGLTLKWTDQKNDKGMFEALEKKSGLPPKVLEFKDIEEFYQHAESLGFSR